MVNTANDLDICSIADLEDAIADGVDAKRAFESVQEWMRIREEYPEEWVEILDLLYEHGLPGSDIKNWLEKQASSYMEDYIVESGSDFYEKFGVEAGKIVDHWLDRYGWRYFGEEELSGLPSVISVGRLVSFFSMKEIIENCAPYSFNDFLSDYLKVGQDINILARKFMDEIGYSSDSSDSGAMLDLVQAGASADIIDPAEYIEVVDATQLDDCEAGNWYDYFKRNGFNSQLISKLRK